MNYVRDKFGNILSKNSFVAYVKNGLIERGRVVELVHIGMSLSEFVKIEPLNEYMPIVTKSANEVMSVILPAT